MAFKRKYRLYRRKTRRGKYSRRKGARTFQSRVKKVLMKAAETKYYDIGFENEQLYHNSGTQQLLFPGYLRSISQWFNPWSVIDRGTARFNRIGDKITPRGMSVKLYLANKVDRPNCMFRVIVAILPKIVAGDITAPRFDPFQICNSGLLGNYMITPADHDKGVKFLYDRIHRMNNTQRWNGGQYERELTKTIKIWIKRKRSRDIVYDTTSSDIVNKPLAIYVIPYEQYSTYNTDNVASCAGLMRMYFKDV